MRVPVWTLCFAFSLALGACGGGDDDGGGDGAGDALPLPDGGGIVPDAMPQAGTALGRVCSGEGQGDCPTGYSCQALQGGSYCSKECEPGAGGNTFCNTDYDGPGLALCLTGVDTNQDQMADYFICGVLCEDTAIGQCDAETCDGTCPNGQSCTAPVRNQGGDEVGKGCAP